MRIAVTSQNFRTITGHAGRARRFMVFEESADGEPREVERLDLPKELSFHEFHSPGPHPLDSVDLVVTGGCGAGFARRLAGRGIGVVVTGEQDPARAARALLRGEALPPPTSDGHEGQGHHHGHG